MLHQCCPLSTWEDNTRSHIVLPGAGRTIRDLVLSSQALGGQYKILYCPPRRWEDNMRYGTVAYVFKEGQFSWLWIVHKWLRGVYISILFFLYRDIELYLFRAVFWPFNIRHMVFCPFDRGVSEFVRCFGRNCTLLDAIGHVWTLFDPFGRFWTLFGRFLTTLNHSGPCKTKTRRGRPRW